MSSDDASLHFGRSHRPEGFTSAALAPFDGSAEPVVRELLQNSVDAAREAGVSPAEVRFIITEAHKDDLPGWSAYRHAFKAARKQRRARQDSKPSHDEKMVVDRIEQSSRAAMIPLLVCIDNGHGLNGRRMDALLTPGNTSKGEGGAGSFGLGHHAAFGASNLRYVLYGAKYVRDDGYVAQIASGHAILASHRDTGGSLRAADGYWFKSGKEESAFDDTFECYPDILPPLLKEYLIGVETGTVVCIVGFNGFHREDSDPTVDDSIRRVTAANFSDAIHEGSLVVSIDNDHTEAATRVDSAALCGILEPFSRNKRAEKHGQINGRVAYDAWRTISLGDPLPSVEGVVIRCRRPDPSDRQPTRVHVFRKGMWITSRAPGLTSSDFSDTWPFDAVVSLDSGQLENLVRSAEGPEHRGIDRRRLNNKQKKQYRELVAEIASQLRRTVGKRDDLQDFVPKGFATLSGHDVRTAERMRRPRIPVGGGSQKERIEGGQQTGGGKSKSSRRRGVPRSGSRPRYRTALRLEEATVIEADLLYEEVVGQQSEVGIRVRVASGADGSCEQPLPDDFLQIASVKDDAGRTVRAGGPEGELELSLPAVNGPRRLTVKLASPISDPQLIELDLVKRKTAVPQDSSKAEDGQS